MTSGNPQPKSQRRTKLDIAVRRGRVQELCLRERCSIEAAAHELGVSIATVNSDLEWLHQEALSAAAAEAKRRLAEYNSELEAIKGEAWRAYKRSLQAKEVQTEGSTSRDEEPERDGTPRVAKSTAASAKRTLKRVRTGQDGDPRYFGIIVSIIEKQAKLFRVGGFGSSESPASEDPFGGGPPVVVYLPDNGRGPQSAPDISTNH